MPLSRNLVLLLCAGVVTMTSIGMNSFSLFLRPIEAEFGWSRTTATLPYMFGMLGWGVGGVLFGKWADDLGARRVILPGVLLMAAGFFGMGYFAKFVATVARLRHHGRPGQRRLRIGDHLAAGRQALRGQSPRARRQRHTDGLAAEPAVLFAVALLLDRKVRLARRGIGQRRLAACGGISLGMARRARSGRCLDQPARSSDLGKLPSLPA